MPMPLARETLTRTRRGNFDVWSDGTILPVVRGGAFGDPPPADPPPTTQVPPAPPTPPANDEKVTRTKAEDDAVAAGIRKEAERTAKKTAERQVAETLGVSLDEAKQIIQERNEAKAAAQTEAERREAAAQERERKADERESKAAAKERQTDAKAALLAAGIKLPEKAEDRAKKLSRATSLLLAEAGDDADEAAINAAAETLKAEMPELFGAVSGGAPSGDPSGVPKPGGAGQPVGIEAGRQRSIARKANTTTDPNADPFGAFSKLG